MEHRSIEHGDLVETSQYVGANASDDIAEKAEEAASLMKALSHGGRLMILCHLAKGEKSVRELEDLLGVRQAAVSQQLARLRFEGLVDSRRDGKAIYYTVADGRALKLVSAIKDIFCPDE